MELEINKHLDAIESMEKRVDADIERLMKTIDISEVVADPVAVLSEIAEALDDLLEEKYHDEALKYGISFAKRIRGKDV